MPDVALELLTQAHRPNNAPTDRKVTLTHWKGEITLCTVYSCFLDTNVSLLSFYVQWLLSYDAIYDSEL